MKGREDELLRGLREAWRALDAPPAEDADDVARDPGTRAAVEWARAAWDALEAPSAPVLPRRAVRPSVVRGLFALAAALFLFWLGLSHGSRDARPLPVARGDSPRAELESVEPRDPTPVRHATPIRPLLHEDGSIEMRAGKVRLILVPDPPVGARERTENTESETRR